MSNDSRHRSPKLPPYPSFEVEVDYPNAWEEEIHDESDNTTDAAQPTKAAHVTPRQEYIESYIHRGTFTQLMTAAQQCGLPLNLDLIIAVRDREFPAKRYQKAFDTLAALAVSLNTQAARRIDDIRRFEMQFRAGAIKISPKEWMLKQRRDLEQTQRIERASRQFSLVLDGLNALRADSQ
jgi:hypothetical protein